MNSQKMTPTPAWNLYLLIVMHTVESFLFMGGNVCELIKFCWFFGWETILRVTGFCITLQEDDLFHNYTLMGT